MDTLKDEEKNMEVEERARGFMMEYEALKKKWGMQHGVKNEFVIFELNDGKQTGDGGANSPAK